MMSWHSLPVAVMAGISGCAAVLSLGFYFVLTTTAQRRARRENLTFALMCLTVMAYDITCVGLYNARSLEQGILWQRGNFTFAALIGVTYMIFTWDFLRGKLPTLARVFVWILLPLSPVLAFWESPWTVTTAAPDIKHIVVGRTLDVVYFEGRPGALCSALMVIFFLAYLYAVVTLFRYFRTQSRRGIAGFLLASVVSFLTAINDSLVAGGVYQFVYTFEYGIAMILMAMGNALFLRFGDLHEEVAQLNDGLARTNADLKTALAQATESARVKTEFLASISHELRTPLNAIINLPEGGIEEFARVTRARCAECEAEFELEAGDAVDEATACPACTAKGKLAIETAWQFQGDPETSRRHLVTVSRAGRHLLELVDDMLDASKLELGRMTLTRESIDLTALVTEVVESMQTLGERGNVRLVVSDPMASSPGAPVLRIDGDRVKLCQVLYNLVSNAIKFSPPQSTVDLRVRAQGAEHALLTVVDRGIGIAKENHEMIFEAFRQVQGGATRSYGGTGLGLAISKSIVLLHGGKIWVESREGEGSVFHVLLPRQTSDRRV